jgi:hypothetical protein
LSPEDGSAARQPDNILRSMASSIIRSQGQEFGHYRGNAVHSATLTSRLRKPKLFVVQPKRATIRLAPRKDDLPVLSPAQHVDLPPSEIRLRHSDPRQIRFRRDLTEGPYTVGERGRRFGANPITGIAGCCALATTGQAAAAPPSSVMSSRRLTPGMGASSPRAGATNNRPGRWPARSVSHSACHRQAGGSLGQT